MTNETNCNPGCNVEQIEMPTKKQIFNADFAFIALTVATLHSFVMVYSLVFLS